MVNFLGFIPLETLAENSFPSSLFPKILFQSSFKIASDFQTLKIFKYELALRFNYFFGAVYLFIEMFYLDIFLVILFF